VNIEHHKQRLPAWPRRSLRRRRSSADVSGAGPDRFRDSRQCARCACTDRPEHVRALRDRWWADRDASSRIGANGRLTARSIIATSRPR